MVYLFVFNSKSVASGHQLAQKIIDRNDVLFAFAVVKFEQLWQTRIYTCQKINEIIFDMLNVEFQLEHGYVGWTLVTLDILNDERLYKQLLMPPMDIEMLRTLCYNFD